MALVDYLDEAQIPYSTSITPNVRPSVIVMHDGTVRSQVSRLESSLKMSLVHNPIIATEFAIVRDWIRANRENEIRILGNDNRTYIGRLEQDGYQANAIGSNHYRISLNLAVGVNPKPSTIIDANQQIVGDRTIRFSFTEPSIRAGEFLRYLFQWRLENEDWSATKQQYLERQTPTSFVRQVVEPVGSKGFVRVRTEAEIDGEIVVADWSNDTFIEVVGAGAKLTNFAYQIVNDIALLTWDETTQLDTFLGYYLEQRLDDADWENVAVIRDGQYSVNMFATRGKRHAWRVRIKNAVGFGEYSDILYYTHPLNPVFTVGTKANPIIISNPKNYRNQDVFAVLRRQGFGLDNGTYFRFTVPISERESMYRILLTGSPTSSNWDIAQADGSIKSEGSSINEELTFPVVAGSNFDFAVYPHDLNASESIQRLLLTIIDFVQDEPEPFVLSANNVLQTRIPLSWTEPDDNQSALLQYQIQMSLDQRDWFTVQIGSLARSFTVSQYQRSTDSEPQDIEPNSTYYFRGRSRNGIGWSEFSNVLRVTTLNFGLLQGRWELGRSGIDAGITTTYYDYVEDRNTAIPRGTGIAQFILESFGGYSNSEIRINHTVAPGSSVWYDNSRAPQGGAIGGSNTRGNLTPSDVNILQWTNGFSITGENQIVFVAAPILYPLLVEFESISFSCTNPSGVSHFDSEDQ